MEPEDSAGEKLELLQRAEVRTMAKDIAALQEQEALKEWEKIQNVQTAGSAQTNLKEPPASRLAASSAALPSSLFRMPELPSVSQKILVRVVLGIIAVLVLFNIAMFFYWYFVK